MNTSETQPLRTISGVQAMRGIGMAEARGFWAEAWTRVLSQRRARVALVWVSIVAVAAVIGPLIASGHPLLMWPVADDGTTGRMTSPLLRQLKATDWLLLVGSVAALAIMLARVKTPRGPRLGMIIAMGVQAGFTTAVAAGMAGMASSPRASDWVRQTEQTGWFVPAASIVSAVVVALLFLVPPTTRTLRARVLLVGLTGLVCAVVLWGTWKRPLDRFEYAQQEARGARMVYTLVPFSPAQRPIDRDSKLLPPGSSSDEPLVRQLIQGMPAVGALTTDQFENVLSRIDALPLPPEERATLTASLREGFQGSALPDRAAVRLAAITQLRQLGHRHYLGTDSMGQDVASQMLHAARLAVSIGVVSTGLAVLIGVTMGSLMGYFGGIIDLLLYRIVEIFMAVPVLFLLIVAAGVLPRNTYVMMAIIGCFTWHSAARFTRAEFMKLRNQDFVQGAKAVGLPLRSILFKHMLPNGVTPVLVDASFLIAAAILIEATLSYLGLGPADQASWGKLLASATGEAGGFLWWLAIFPGVAIFLTVLSYNMLGESLRDAIDPKLRKARV